MLAITVIIASNALGLRPNEGIRSRQPGQVPRPSERHEVAGQLCRRLVHPAGRCYGVLTLLVEPAPAVPVNLAAEREARQLRARETPAACRASSTTPRTASASSTDAGIRRARASSRNSAHVSGSIARRTNGDGPGAWPEGRTVGRRSLTLAG